MLLPPDLFWLLFLVCALKRKINIPYAYVYIILFFFQYFLMSDRCVCLDKMFYAKDASTTLFYPWKSLICCNLKKCLIILSVKQTKQQNNCSFEKSFSSLMPFNMFFCSRLSSWQMVVLILLQLGCFRAWRKWRRCVCLSILSVSLMLVNECRAFHPWWGSWMAVQAHTSLWSWHVFFVMVCACVYPLSWESTAALRASLVEHSRALFSYTLKESPLLEWIWSLVWTVQDLFFFFSFFFPPCVSAFVFSELNGNHAITV